MYMNLNRVGQANKRTVIISVNNVLHSATAITSQNCINTYFALRTKSKRKQKEQEKNKVFEQYFLQQYAKKHTQSCAQ